MTMTLLLGCVAVLLASSVAAIVMAASRRLSMLVYSLTLTASTVALVTAAMFLVSGSAPMTARLPIGLPWTGANFRLDGLAALFVVVVNLGAMAASLYGFGHGRHEDQPHRVLPFFAAFIAGMNLVVMADDAFMFLMSWEFMSLTSWALVVSHHRQSDNIRAGFVYLVMASFGTLALLLAFGLLAGPDSHYTFAAIRDAQFTPTMAAVILALVLLGAGSKAGMVPLHVWLPLAHPAAPSHVSALMSGVMTKVAIYGFIRIIFDLVDEPTWWASMSVLALGGATAVLGVLYALMQHDLKRLLAYHTVENIGIIFIGLGLAIGFQANHLPQAAALATTGALLHVFNHSIFKSLLFFGAGAVLSATGERDMEKLGGLIHRMPVTSFTFLVGSAAISALPPLNGFVSEWLTFQAILQSPQMGEWGLKILVPVVGGLLALAAALAAACFVKAFGVTFLGRARSAVALSAGEVDRFRLAAMIGFSAVCVAVGIFPGLAADGLASAVSATVGHRLAAQASHPWLSIVPLDDARSSYNGFLVMVFIAFSALLAAYLVHRFASQSLRRGPAWDCGFRDQTADMQYTAGSFAQPIRRVFGETVFLAREDVDMPAPGDMRPARFHVTMRDLIWELIYARAGSLVGAASDRLNHFQFLTIRRYLSLVFLALIALLLVIALWP